MATKVQASMSILIVDDSETMRAITRDLLHRVGFKNVNEVADGKAALNYIRKAYDEKRPVELVLCDWNMTELSGMDVLTSLRSDERFKELPFLMVTSENELHQVSLAIRFGVSDYIVKPFTIDLFKKKLASIYKDLEKRQKA